MSDMVKESSHLDSEHIEVFRQVQELLANYFVEARRPETSVVDYAAPEALAEHFDFSLPQIGETEAALPALVQDYLSRSVRSANPRFFNQLFGGFLLPGVVGEHVAAMTNTSMYTYECAPMATLMEQAVLDEMCRSIGFSEGEGLLVTGGSNANLVAMNAARYRMRPSVRTQGQQGGANLVAFVSDQAHYSFEKAAALMGLGTQNIIRVASDHEGAMRPDALVEAIAAARRLGSEPFFVGATAGTTVRGAFDPIEDLAGICAGEGLWLHIDGSWGGSVALSSQYAHLLQGAENADSMTWNPHKMMGLPLPCSAILFREKGTLAQVHSVAGTEYLFHEEDNLPDLGPLSLQCGRRVDALKLWLAWRCLGTEGFAQRIDHLFSMCQAAKERVEQAPDLELIRQPISVNLLFRYRPKGVECEREMDRITLALRKALHHRGLALVNYATVDGAQVFRMVFANADHKRSDIDRFFDDLLGCADDLFNRAAS